MYRFWNDWEYIYWWLGYDLMDELFFDYGNEQ